MNFKWMAMGGREKHYMARNKSPRINLANKLSYKFTRRTRRKMNLPILTPFCNNRPACGGLLVF